MLSIVKDVLTRLYAFLGGDIYYINSGEALPPPLSREEEAKIMEQLRAGDEDVKQTLIERNLRLVVYIARKFENTGVCVEDLISIGTIGLIKAVNTFDAEKRIKLATYASRCIENEILMYLRRSCKLKLEVSLDEPLNVDWDGNELLLSDILGTDADAIYRGIEDEVDKEAHSERKEDYGAALRSIWQQGVHPEAGRRHDGNIPKLHKQAGKAHNQVAEVRDATDDVRRKKRGIAL